MKPNLSIEHKALAKKSFAILNKIVELASDDKVRQLMSTPNDYIGTDNMTMSQLQHHHDLLEANLLSLQK